MTSFLFFFSETEGGNERPSSCIACSTIETVSGFTSSLWFKTLEMVAGETPASFEIYAIAAVVLGGISMSGGKGKCLGILFGSLSYTVIDKIIIALKMNSLINDAVKGIILIVVILIQVAGPQIKQRMEVMKSRKREEG